LLKDAYASYECNLLDNKTYGDHVWVVGDIVRGFKYWSSA
jgi:flavin reductase (DIM6/NTAB) family NADH-FMN oxidoreductase RutF